MQSASKISIRLHLSGLCVWAGNMTFFQPIKVFKIGHLSFRVLGVWWIASVALGLNFYAVAAEEEDISVPKVKLAMWVCISFRIYFKLILLYIIKTRMERKKGWEIVVGIDNRADSGRQFYYNLCRGLLCLINWSWAGQENYCCFHSWQINSPYYFVNYIFKAALETNWYPVVGLGFWTVWCKKVYRTETFKIRHVERKYLFGSDFRLRFLYAFLHAFSWLHFVWFNNHFTTQSSTKFDSW